MAGDWIMLNRKLSKSDLWLNGEFSRGQAWVDLLMLANWKPGHVRIREVRIDLNRGQLAGSVVWLAARWKWSRGKVARFLNELETEQQIGQQKSNVTTVVTIVNYDSYQQTGQQTGQQAGSRRAASDTADGQQTDTQEEGRRREEGKEGKESSVGSGQPTTVTADEFFTRWNSFAERKGLAVARLLSPERRKKINTRLRQNGWFESFLLACAKLPIPANAWQPDLDWIVKNETSVSRLLEGKYDWKSKQGNEASLAAKDRARSAMEYTPDE